jgi:hypothetical protein
MIEAITALFMITSLWAAWFWGIVCFILVLVFSENEKNFWAFFTVGMFITIMELSGTISIFSNPISLLVSTIAYFVIGGLWSFVKWFSFIHKRADEFAEAKLTFIREFYNKTKDVCEIPVDVKTKIPDRAIASFNKFLRREYLGKAYYTGYSHGYDEDSLEWVIPQATNFKSKIVTWILWWPTSVVWTVLNDPLVRLANWMYRRFQGVYRIIAKRAFSKFEIE